MNRMGFFLFVCLLACFFIYKGWYLVSSVKPPFSAYVIQKKIQAFFRQTSQDCSLQVYSNDVSTECSVNWQKIYELVCIKW